MVRTTTNQEPIRATAKLCYTSHQERLCLALRIQPPKNLNTAIPCVWPTRLAMVVGGTTSEDRRCVGWTKSCGVVGATYIMLQE